MPPPTPDPAPGSSSALRQTAEVMTLVFTELAGAVRLKEEVGNQEAWRLIEQHHAELRSLLKEFPDGFEAETLGDSCLFGFSRPSDAVQFALRLQARLRRWNRGKSFPLLDRIGIHAGEVLVERDSVTGRVKGLRGLEVDKCARVMALGEAQHILLTRFAFDNARAMLKGQRLPGVGEVSWVAHGFYEFRGVGEPVEVCEVAEARLGPVAPPPDSEYARRQPDQPDAQVLETSFARPDTWLARVRTPVQPTHRFRGWGVAVTIMAGVAALVLPIGERLAEISYDLAYWFRKVEVPTEAVIVRMDRPSHDELQQPWLHPWDRRVHARLLDHLKAAGAAAVVFDIHFDSPASDPEEDRAFIEAARRFGKVAVAGIEKPDMRNGEVVGRQIEGPFLALREVVRWGLANRGDADSYIRKLPPARGAKVSLAEEAARLVATNDLKALPGVAWMNYYGRPGSLESFSYSQVLSNYVPAARFTGKLVFVGAVYDLGYTGGRGTDDFMTPYSRATGLRMPGVEIIATAALNVRRGEWLTRISPWTELLLVLGFGALAGWGFPQLRPAFGGVLALSGGALLAVLGLAQVWWTYHWFSWLVPVAVQIPVGYAVALISVAQARSTGHTEFRRRPAGTAATARQSESSLPPPAFAPAAAGPANRSLPKPQEDAATVLLSETGTGPTIPNYELLRQVGQGAYGEVWLARDAVGLLRAVKFVYRRSFPEPAPYEREFEGIRQFTPIALRHSGLVHVLHVGRDDPRGFFYYVMEAADDMDGGPSIDPATYRPRTLAADLERSGALEAAAAIRLGLQLCDALEFLHSQRLVHRDLKPSNILFAQNLPKLGDVGLVTAMKSPGGDVSFVGTRNFIPPEGPGAAAADVYSLGKVLYVAVTAHSPARFPELPSDLDPRRDRAAVLALNRVLLKACEPEESARYQSAAELQAALARLESLGEEPPTLQTG